MAIVEDLKRDFSLILEMSKTDISHNEIRIKFIEFIQFHADAKMLSIFIFIIEKLLEKINNF